MEIFIWVPNNEYGEDIDFDIDETMYQSGKKQRYINNPDPILHRFALQFINRDSTEINAIVHFLRARHGRYDPFLFASILEGDYRGSANSGTTTKLDDSALAGYSDRFFVKRIVLFISGSNEGVEREITISSIDGYIQWVTPLIYAVAEGDEYAIYYKVNLESVISPRTQSSVLRRISLSLVESN